MDVFELCGVAVITAVLAVTVRQYRPELAVQVSVAGGAVLLLICAARYADLPREIKAAFEQSGVDGGWLELVLKLCGIAFITQISADICRDAGESALAAKTELCGRVMMLACALPALLSLLRLLTGLAESIGY